VGIQNPFNLLDIFRNIPINNPPEVFSQAAQEGAERGGTFDVDDVAARGSTDDDVATITDSHGKTL
jgi:hypothetical protein